MAEKEIEVFDTTAGQVTDVLKRLGVDDERMITVTIEPDDWLTKARRESRHLVIRRCQNGAQGELSCSMVACARCARARRALNCTETSQFECNGP